MGSGFVKVGQLTGFPNSDGTDGRQGPWYQASALPNEPNMFTTSDSQHHASMRKPIASAYTASYLVQLESFVDNCVGLLKTRFSEFARSQEYIDIGHWMQLFSLDAIGEISVSHRRAIPPTENKEFKHR